jgi:transcriptional regulator with XRE-family HTH domain
MTEMTIMKKEQNRESLFNIKIGIFFYSHRRILDLRQEELEKLIPLSRSCISLIEHGQRSASGNNISILLEFFGFTMGQGFNIIDDPKAIKEHLEKFRIICNENQENVDFLFSYWSEKPPLDEKDPILILFPPKNLKKNKR